MKLTSSWVNSMLRRTMSDDKIIEALERAGLEIEQISSSKEIDERVVVALVKKVIQHPGANRLKLVDVWTGERETRVVCGAPNVRPDIMVALAQPGSTLPGGDRIEKAKLRGELSEGMLCSEVELGVGNDHNGILELSSDAVPGTPLCDLYPADTVVDLKTPANRFDVLSVVGLAREVAAMSDNELKPLSPPPVSTTADGPAVSLGAEAARYMLARIAVDQTPPSPGWMTARLRAAGMRPLGLLVDITNYVMLEQGQPLHAFDAHKVTLPIGVRRARTGEQLTTLDGVLRKLTDQDLIIADQTGPIALAGLMGGLETEIGPDTKEILLESAVFDAATVRKMAKRHGLRTEASARFERALPVELAPLALARATELLVELASGQVEAASDQLNVRPTVHKIELAVEKLSRLLGFGVSNKEAVEALGKLHISGESHKDVVTVPEVPWWRPDVRLPEDLVEEVVRVVGYEHVPATLPHWKPTTLQFDRMRSRRRQVRDLLYAAGLFEVMTYSFVSKQQLEDLGLDPGRHLKLKNPLSTEQAYLRSTILPSHLAVLTKNRTYAKDMAFYEIANVFVKRAKGDLPNEFLRLAVTVQGELAYRKVKGILEAIAAELNLVLAIQPNNEEVFAPNRSAEVRLGKEMVGRIGQVHPERVRPLKIEAEVALAEIDLSPLILNAGAKQFAGVARYPTISRDLAISVPHHVSWQDVLDAVAPETAVFVDDYFGAGLQAGHKGLTLRLVLVNPDRTPTEAEASDLETTVLTRLERKLGAQRRS